MDGPAYNIRVNNWTVDTTDEPRHNTIVDLTVAVDINALADSFALVLGQVNGRKPARSDEATIELGYTDNGDLSQVMRYERKMEDVFAIQDEILPMLSLTQGLPGHMASFGSRVPFRRN